MRIQMYLRNEAVCLERSHEDTWLRFLVEMLQLTIKFHIC